MVLRSNLDASTVTSDFSVIIKSYVVTMAFGCLFSDFNKRGLGLRRKNKSLETKKECKGHLEDVHVITAVMAM